MLKGSWPDILGTDITPGLHHDCTTFPFSNKIECVMFIMGKANGRETSGSGSRIFCKRILAMKSVCVSNLGNKLQTGAFLMPKSVSKMTILLQKTSEERKWKKWITRVSKRR